MIAVLQRVQSASVAIDGVQISSIGQGLLILLGIAQGDTPEICDALCEKALGLRIFEDENGKMNRSVRDVFGGVLTVSQFTLLADCKKGRRPSFTGALSPSEAIPLYERFLALVAADPALSATGSGRFSADMQVTLQNDGPVTIVLDSNTLF